MQAASCARINGLCNIEPLDGWLWSRRTLAQVEMGKRNLPGSPTVLSSPDRAYLASARGCS
jgi:hypothetical protein